MLSSDLPRIRPALLRWYRRSARPFPWRTTRDPYRILVSEVMLQQTQASRVVSYYRAFLKRFPTVQALARASRGSVLRSWQGLGYNMRALRLHATAVDVQRHRRGLFPTTAAELMELPGVGPYTARAVAAFSFGRAEAVVDTNVRRILRRLYPRSTEQTDFQALADRLLARRAAQDWNQAVMELGATICLPIHPRCEACPIKQQCPSAGRAIRVRSKRPTREALYRGHPRRIYRGRIVTILNRATSRSHMTDARLATHLFTSSRATDRNFVRNVVAALERDGLVSIKRSPKRWQVRSVR